ncbi:MAG: BON domain-containing protein, partial [Pontibacterium sp.]
GTNIAVTSYNGIVLLTGQASSDATRARAEQIVSEVSKVRRIYNEVTVSGTTSTLSTANDAWLTTKVKTQLLVDETVDGHRVKVVTESGTVYLMGLLTPTEADSVINIVRQIGGVQRIVKMFEYIERP